MAKYKRRWEPLPPKFKKHPGKTVPQIAWTDPGYVVWLATDANLCGQLASETQEVYRKMQRIRPKTSGSGETQAVEYFAYWSDGKFAKAELTPPSQSQHDGGSRTIIKPCWDLTVPYRMAGGHKHTWGNEMLIKTVKKNLFDKPTYRMTRKRAESFFENDCNFAL